MAQLHTYASGKRSKNTAMMIKRATSLAEKEYEKKMEEFKDKVAEESEKELEELVAQAHEESEMKI